MAALTTQEVMERLRQRHSGEDWGYLEEVRNQTGYGRVTRSADAIAMSLWPSKGLHLHGFEVKASRSDLMHEFQNPEKHKEIAKYCHFWWLVVGDSKIIKDGELPSGWGLMVPRGDKLMVKVHAPLREAEQVSYGFLASIFRQVSRGGVAEIELRKAKDEGYRSGRAAGEESARYNLRRQIDKVDELKRAIAEFTEKSGIDIDRWNAGRIGEIVNFLANNGRSKIGHHVCALDDFADKIKAFCSTVEGIDQAVDVLRKTAIGGEA